MNVVVDYNLDFMINTLSFRFYPESNDLIELHRGVAEARAISVDNPSKKNEDNYPKHLSDAVVAAAVRKGRLVQGRISVNKHHASKEAFVVRAGGKDGNEEDILIAGMNHR